MTGSHLPSGHIAEIQKILGGFTAWTPMPSDDELKEILDVVFFASLDREEGRPISVGVAYAPRGDGKQVRFVQPFAKATPLTSYAVRKLAMAVDPWRSVVAVEPASGGGLQVWGLGLRGRRRSEPLGAGRGIAQLVVRATGPGVIKVEHMELTVWVYDRGKSSIPAGSVHTLSYLARAFPTALGDWRPMVLLWLSRRIAEGGHGGTMTIVKRDKLNGLQINDSLTFVPPRARMRERYESYWASWRARYQGRSGKEAGAADQQDSNTTLDIVNGLGDELNAVARLAAVDGTIILESDSLDVLAFGAMFTTSGDPEKIVKATSSEADMREVRLPDLGGARHQSAAKWCYEYGPAGFAIVVSQDGPTSLIRRVGDVVLALGPLQVESEHEGVVDMHQVPYPLPKNPRDFFGPIVPGPS